MLNIKELSVKVGEKEILNKVSFDFEKGKNYCILGKNGSGKSSLAMAITGNPKYEISGGDILLNGESIKALSADERSKRGIFLSFQNIPEIPGVKLFEFLKAIYDIRQEHPSSFMGFKKIVEPLIEELGLSKDFLWRDLNVGFSGGEKRKVEILQIKLLNPEIIILDEIDSGLDVNAVRQTSEMLKAINNDENSFLIITHLFDMLEGLPIEKVVILEKGEIKEVGDEGLMEKIKKEGF